MFKIDVIEKLDPAVFITTFLCSHFTSTQKKLIFYELLKFERSHKTPLQSKPMKYCSRGNLQFNLHQVAYRFFEGV